VAGCLEREFNSWWSVVVTRKSKAAKKLDARIARANKRYVVTVTQMTAEQQARAKRQ
jgi:hypothetical protein